MEAVHTADFTADESIGAVVHSLYQFMEKIQRPRPRDRRWSQKTQQYCRELSEYAALVKEGMAEKHRALSALLDEVVDKVSDYSRELSERPSAGRLKTLGKSLSLTYENMLVQVNKSQLKLADKFPAFEHLKPTNYYRNLFHMSMGVVAVFLYELVLTKGQAMSILLTLLGIFTFLEITRRFSSRWNDFLMDNVFSIIARPHERHRTNGATYYLLALSLLTAITPKTALEVGILILAFGDPAASVAGKRWGKRKLWKEKSVVGTLAFLAASTTVVVCFLTLVEPWMAFARMLGLAFTVSLAGAATELYSQRINDNFTIPVVCAGLATFWF